MVGPISFWGHKEQESNLILPEHDDDDEIEIGSWAKQISVINFIIYNISLHCDIQF